MTKKQRTILLAIVGVVGVSVIAVVGTAIWIVRSHVENVSMDEATATRSLDDIRTRFGNIGPVISLHGGGPVLVRRPTGTQSAATLKTLHVLRWDGRSPRGCRGSTCHSRCYECAMVCFV